MIAKGIEASKAGYSGAAISGKSYSRQNEGGFVATDPTPGFENNHTMAVALIAPHYPFSKPVSSTGISWGSGLLLAVVFGFFLSAGALYAIKHSHEEISNLFFGRDEKDSRELREGDVSC